MSAFSRIRLTSVLVTLLIFGASCSSPEKRELQAKLVLKTVDPGWTPEYFTYLSKKAVLEKIQDYARAHEDRESYPSETLDDFSCPALSGSWSMGAPARLRQGATVLVKLDSRWLYGEVVEYQDPSEQMDARVVLHIPSQLRAVTIGVDKLRISYRHPFPYEG